jgi:hypothetical protein
VSLLLTEVLGLLRLRLGWRRKLLLLVLVDLGETVLRRLTLSLLRRLLLLVRIVIALLLGDVLTVQLSVCGSRAWGRLWCKRLVCV